MSNINKILITVTACVFMICVASVSIVGIVTSNKNDVTTTAPTTTTEAPASQQGEVATTTAPTTTTAPSQSVVHSTTSPAPTTVTASTEIAAEADLASALLGSWKDSAGMSGYEFLEGGKVNGTFFDLAGFGVPLDGTTPGTYSLEGDTLTIKFSIYTATIKKTYRISISQNELSMYDLEEHETSTYMRVS